MSELRNTIFNLTQKMKEDCNDMKKALSRFPIKVIKSYRKHHFSDDNTIDVKGKQMKVTDLIDYIEIEYGKLKKLSNINAWRSDIKECANLYKRGKSGINYAHITYKDFKKKIESDFYDQLKDMTNIATQIAKSMKNFTLTESEELDMGNNKLSKKMYDKALSAIYERVEDGELSETEGVHMQSILKRENLGHFKRYVSESVEALDTVFTNGFLTESEYNTALDRIHVEIAYVEDSRTPDEFIEELAKEEDELKLEDAFNAMCGRLYEEASFGIIDVDERERLITKLRDIKNSSLNFTEFSEKVQSL